MYILVGEELKKKIFLLYIQSSNNDAITVVEVHNLPQSGPL